MDKIEPYIMSESGGFSWYHFLHIQGGEGHGKTHLGGRFKFVIAYLTPDEAANQTNEMGQSSLDIYCEDKSIAFGGGDTIQDAYANFKTSL